MKKLIAVVLVFSVVLLLSACIGDVNENSLPKTEMDEQNTGKDIEGKKQTDNIETDTESQQVSDVEYPTYVLIDSASFDIDNDGVFEDCDMAVGPTSGLFTIVITASVDGSIKYKNTFNLVYGDISFDEESGVIYFVRDEEYHRIFVDDNCIVIEDLDPKYEGYYGGSDWNFNLR